MAYKITLSSREFLDLSWFAGRWSAPQILQDGMDLISEDGDLGLYEIPEHVMWEASEALELEGGIFPCLDYSSTLGEKIRELFEAVV